MQENNTPLRNRDRGKHFDTKSNLDRMLFESVQGEKRYCPVDLVNKTKKRRISPKNR